jgi:hypothetical protein
VVLRLHCCSIWQPQLPSTHRVCHLDSYRMLLHPHTTHPLQATKQYLATDNERPFEEQNEFYLEGAHSMDRPGAGGMLVPMGVFTNGASATGPRPGAGYEDGTHSAGPSLHVLSGHTHNTLGQAHHWSSSDVALLGGGGGAGAGSSGGGAAGGSGSGLGLSGLGVAVDVGSSSAGWAPTSSAAGPGAGSGGRQQDEDVNENTPLTRGTGHGSSSASGPGAV